MGQDIDVPDILPVGVTHFDATAGDDSGVGDEQINRTDIGFDGFDQLADILGQ